MEFFKRACEEVELCVSGIISHIGLAYILDIDISFWPSQHWQLQIVYYWSLHWIAIHHSMCFRIDSIY